MTIETKIEQERNQLHDLADAYLSGHDDFTPEEKQALFHELEHQKERLTRLKNPKVKGVD